MIGNLAAIWGFSGVCLFLGSAILRLAEISNQMSLQSFNMVHWICLILWVSVMAYFEGYKGFQKGFSPRVAARVRYLAKHVTLKRFILAPLFCLGYFDAERKRIIVVCCLTIGIFLIVNLVEYIPMPWRGILDLGVVVGLSWGLISMVIFSLLPLANSAYDYPAGVPESKD